MSVAVLAALLGTPLVSHAQVTPDPLAGARRPSTDAAANGVPVVNITAPSAAGVSHNQYQQFNVDKQGLILNNSAGVSATQLGGYIVGNPHYQAGQSARLIVNEVTSTNPTSLRGYTEVAGNAADVIVANPNGIQVDGAGFINTPRATLTTGLPVFSGDGSLSALRVTGGQISIDGAGLDGSNIDRLDFVTRSLAVNSKVWANNLNVVTGANQVDYSDLAAQAIAGEGEAPTIRLDVAALGGMYAHHIALIGTEAGIGVRNAGDLASLSSDFTINEAGQLLLTGTTASAGRLDINGSAVSNSGTLQSSGDMAVHATGDVSNTGTIYSGNNLDFFAGGTLANTGVLAATNNASVHAQQLFSQGVLGAGVASDGSLQGPGALSIVTTGALTSHGSQLASGNLILQGSSLDLSGAQTQAGGNVALTSTTGDIDHRNARLVGSGTLTAQSAGSLDNTGGTLGALGDVALHAASIANHTGTLVAGGNFTLQSDHLNNHQGMLYSAGNLTWHNGSATLDNTAGSITAGNDLGLSLGTVHNESGDIASNHNLAAQFTTFDGTGRLRAGNDLTLTLAGDYANQAGNTLFANHDFTFNVGGTLTNQGTLQSVNALTLNAASVNNQVGAGINSATTTINAAAQTNAGRLEGDTVTLHGADITNTGTVIGNTITVYANNLTNGADLGTVTDNTPYQSALIAATDQLHLYVTGDLLNRDATLYSLGDLSIAADDHGTRSHSVTNRSGDIEAAGNISISTQQFTNERRVLETETHQLTAAEQAQNTHKTHVAISGATDKDLYDYCVRIHVAHKKGCRNNWDIDTNDFLQASGSLITTDVVTSITRLLATSAESRLLAGGNLTLNGSVLNSNSTIAAGNDLIINGQDGNTGGGSVGSDTVQNLAFVPPATVETTVSKVASTKYKTGGIDGGSWHGDNDVRFMQTVTDATLAANGVLPSWITLDPGTSLSSRISAGNAVDINVHDIGNTLVGGDGHPVIGVGLGNPTIGDNAHAIQLPSSGLYSIHSGSGSPYLVETDPRFASYAGFLGSDYLLGRLGLDGDATLKRLGDAFYETQLVVDQITSLTGRRYLPGDTDALEQYKALMDAGVQQAEAFNLAVGVALTPEQMASLTQDMVWLVSQTVDGEQVLVPVVYLSQQTTSNLASGAVIQGNSVALNATNQLTNTGSIQANQNASVTASNLLNAGTLTAGSDLSLQTAQDLLNVGTIHGDNVTLAAGNNLTSTADTGHANLGNVNLSGLSLSDAQRLGVASGGLIAATDTLIAQAGNTLSLDHANVSAGKDLGLAAGNDLTATASTITAGNTAQLIAGNNLTLNADQHTEYAGTGNRLTVSTVHDVTTVKAGGSAVLAAGNDLTSQGAQLTAGDQLILSAGHDVVLNAVTDNAISQSFSQNGKTHIATLDTDQTLRGTSVNATNGVAISAGNNLTSVAGTVTSSHGNVTLAAGNDINLIAGAETHTHIRDTDTKTSGLLSSSETRTHDAISDTYAVGTQIAANTVSLAAGHDLTAQAAYLNADTALTLAAGHDVTLTDAQDLHSETHTTETKSFNFFSDSSKRFGSVDPEWRSTTDSVQINQASSVGSVLSGDSVTVAAGNNLTATNAQVVATNDAILAAGHDLTLTAGENTYDYTQSHGTSHTGLMNNGGLSVLIGNRSTKDTATVHDVSYRGSTVGSLNGSVILSAGNDLHITGSDVISDTATTLVGKNVTIDAAVGTTDITDTHKVSTGGINVGLGGAAVELATAAYGTAQHANDVHDDRLKALDAAKAAYLAHDAAQALGQGVSQNGIDGGINLQVGIGGSSASSTTTTHDDTTYGSTIRSHGNVTIAATDGDLNIIGSQIAGQDVALAATHDLNIRSQQETHTLQSSNQNVSAGVGLQIGTDGIGIYAQASVGKGSAHGNGLTHTDSTVDANGTLTLLSGNDTTLKGTQLTGNQVIANIGNNLLIQSEQDTDDYASKQWQADGKVVIGMGGGGISYSQTKVNSHYASVSDVTGISAGDGGFDITVGGNTHLVGGVIASSADPSKNNLTTGTLTYEDIRNESSGKSSSMGLGLDSSMVSGSKYATAKGIASNLLGEGSDSESYSSTTHTAIADGTIKITDESAQQILTGKTAEAAIAGLDRDASLGNQALAHVDLQRLQENAELSQGLKGFAYQVGTHYTDEAYRTMFLKAADIYEVAYDKDGKAIPGRKLTEEEKAHLQSGNGGAVYLANNGIFNDNSGAAKYAGQHSTAGDGPQYYVAFPEANGTLSELLIAAYQHMFENDFWGLTNATEENKQMMLFYGQAGLHLDGHSRGSMTVGNAMESIAKMPGSEGLLSNTTISFFGPAYNAAEADSLLSTLQGYNGASDPLRPSDMVLTLQNNIADPVGQFVGHNPVTGGTIPEGSTVLRQMIRAATGQPNTSHNCYGSPVGTSPCVNFWKSSPGSQAVSVPVN